MTATTGTTGTTGPRPLFKAYEEAKRKNGWPKDGLTEKAVCLLGVGKMMDVWPRMQRPDFQPGAFFPLYEFYGWLHFRGGRELVAALVQSCVVYMTDKVGPIGKHDGGKLRLLDEHMARLAFWAVSECARGGYKREVTKMCIDTLAIGAGCCTDDDWTKYSAEPVRIPLDVLQKEEIDVEKIQAELKKLEVKK